MAEVFARHATWTFDHESVRIVPTRDRRTSKLLAALGEIVAPLAAIAGVAYESGRKGGRLRLRLREGADPFNWVTSGRLSDAADPYQLDIEPPRIGAAEYFAEGVRNGMLVARIPEEPVDRFLMPGPQVPLSAAAGDGTASFDGERIRLEWNWMAEETKTSAGPREFALPELTGVDWNPQSGFGYGYLRFRSSAAAADMSPEHDPNCIAWGVQREGGTTALVAAAVVARLPHPLAGAQAQLEPRAAADGEARATDAPADDPDAVLRRLREPGELHRDGVLTDDEFATAKQALLRGLST